MIRFKQFISENYIKVFSEFLPNGARILFNHHGNHAYKTLDSAEYKKLKHYKQHYTEDTDTSINDWLTEAKNKNEHIPGNTHFDKMKTMEDEYNLSNEHKPAIINTEERKGIVFNNPPNSFICRVCVRS